MELVADPWLAERLGKPAMTVKQTTEPEPALPARLEAGFYQAKIPAERPDLVAALSRRGFCVISAAITLGRDAAEAPPGDTGAVRDAASTDVELLDIAQDGFSRSRFHLDPQIPTSVANRVKRDWVGSYLSGARGERLLVAEADGKPAGFLAVLADGPVRVIDLIAVAEAQRSRGLGQALVLRFLADAPGRTRVGTQGANPRATRFYERLGFVTEFVEYDMHLHLS